MPDETIAINRRARHDYAIEDTLEAGIVLTGTEIKSVRAHKVNIAEAYVRIDHGEAWLIGAHIAEYAQGNRYNHVPNRTRKLLLHRNELSRLSARVNQERLTLVPLRLYFKDGTAKVELALVKGRTKGDKRQALAERDADREMQKAMGRQRKEIGG